MAQQGANQPSWIYDEAQRLYYFRDPRSNDLVYQDGSRVSATPRTQPAMLHNPSAQPAPAGSPTQSPNYIFQSGQTIDSAMRNLNLQSHGPHAYTDDGVNIVEASDPTNRITVRVGYSPAELITDPVLYRSGVRAHRRLYGTGQGNEEQLYSNYRLRQHGFFCLGRMFLVLWVEPAGEANSVITYDEANDRSFSTNAYNERVYSKVRRFIVVREGKDYCSALPIATYGGKGVSKTNVTKSEHAIIYTGREAPTARADELPIRDEVGMRPMAIRIVPDTPTEALDPMSRIDFGKVHTIQHNIKVRPFGNVHRDSKAALLTQFANVWAGVPTVPADVSSNAMSQTTTIGQPVVLNRSGNPQGQPPVAAGLLRGTRERRAEDDLYGEGPSNTWRIKGSQAAPSSSFLSQSHPSRDVGTQPAIQSVQTQRMHQFSHATPARPSQPSQAPPSNAGIAQSARMATNYSNSNPRSAYSTGAIPKTSVSSQLQPSSETGTGNDVGTLGPPGRRPSSGTYPAGDATQRSAVTQKAQYQPEDAGRIPAPVQNSQNPTALPIPADRLRPPQQNSPGQIPSSPSLPSKLLATQQATAQRTAMPQPSNAQLSSSRLPPTPQSTLSQHPPSTQPPGVPGQSSWAEQVRQARAAFNNLLQHGNSQEEAFQQMRERIYSRGGMTPAEADAQIRALLSGNRPPG